MSTFRRALTLSATLVAALGSFSRADIITGLVASYNFSGNADDGTGNGHDGTVSGAQLVADRFGNANSAYQFDGNDYIRIASDPALNGSAGLTLSAWVNPAGISGTIISKWNDDTFDHSYIFKDRNCAERIELSKVNHNDLVDASGGTCMTAGQWVHVAVTYDLNSVRLFYNGVLNGSAVTDGSPIASSVTDLLIGAVFTGGGINENYHGRIDDVRIYNRALSTADLMEIQLSTAAPEAVPEPGTSVLLGSGLALMVAMYRKRRRK